jgi:hypothetical protein
VAAVASIVIAAALVGCGPNLAGETESISPPTATAIPTVTPETTQTVAPDKWVITIPEISPVQLTLTLPAGWNRNPSVVGKTADHLALFPVANVYTDPCHWSGALLDPPVGPSVEDLATALVSQPMRDATVTDITLDGYSGKLVRMSVPADIRFSDCDDGLFGIWTEAGSDDPSRYAHGPGELEDVYVINVGGTRVVISVAHMPFTPVVEVAELQSMVDSITIQR